MALVFAFLLAVPLLSLAADDATLRIPPVKTSFTIENHPVEISASGVLSRVSNDSFQLRLSADLAGLQDNIADLLRPEVDKSNKCGERVSLQRATLVPAAPASLLTVYVHYEKWACAKAFGKEIVKRLVGGNGVVPITLTPVVENNKSVRLDGQVGEIQADGSLGEALRSGSFGASLQEKIRAALLSSIQKGTNLAATLPPGLESFASIRRAEFTDSGGGRLGVMLAGEIRMPADKLRAIVNQASEAAHAH
jgi:hypothetical protein